MESIWAFIVENIWALLALIVSVIGALIAWGAKTDAKAANDRSIVLADENNKLMQQANRLQERIVQIEEGRETERNQESVKADLRCSKTSTRRSFYQLIIENFGKARADEIMVFVNNYPIGEHDAFNVDNFADINQLDNGIRSGGKVALKYALQFGTLEVSHVRITWKNPDGSSGDFETGL